MKPTLLQRLKARTHAARGRLRRGAGAKPRGVAILTVLAIITLMTVLVVSFFNMAKTQQTTAKGSVEMQRVTNLKDTVINLVIAQLREATTLATEDRTVAWISQPGAIRTFSNDNPQNTRVYKLYSAAVPVLTGIQEGQSQRLLDQILSDIEADWDRRPEEFVDLNRPTVNFTLDADQETDRISPDRLSYPIADPRRYNGREDPLENTEGFKYQATIRGKTVRGVDPAKQQLAMPVRWIYVLKDGGLGYLNTSKRFVPLSNGAVVSRENPIVARVAWWTDDESCKINVNTASLPMVWDSPRTTSVEDRTHAAKLIPRVGEYQRYPGHPATVDLSAVFYPGRRWVPPRYMDIIPPGENMQPLDLEDAQRIWDLAPFITSDGTMGGNEEVANSSKSTQGDDRDHLFTSFEELYFRASTEESKSLNRARESLLTQDRSRTFLRRLEESPFFLTHKSHAPETTTHGYPRITTVAMDDRAATIASTGRGEPSGNVSPYDVTIAVNSTIGGKAYYFVREDAGSRHAEIFSTEPTRKRNAEILRYLKILSDIEISGYPELKKMAPLNTLAAKYPAPVEGPSRRRFEDNTKFNRTLDSSDRTQILISMLDYMRTSNLKSGLISTSQQYDGGNGQAAGVCGCGAPGEDLNGNHVRALYDKDQFNQNKKVLFPRGVGRTAGPAEIIIVANVPFVKGPDDQIISGAADRTNMNSMQGMLDPKSRDLWMGQSGAGLTRAMVEIGFIVSGFCPKHGWGPLFPGAGTNVGTEERVGTGDPRSPAVASGNQVLTNTKIHFPFATIIDGEMVPLTVANDQFRRGESLSRNVPKGGVSAGAGMMGPRTFLERGMAIMRPFVQVVQDGGSSVNVSITPYQVNTGGPPRRVRIHIADGEAGTYNTLNVVDLDIPPQMFTGMRLPFNPEGSLRKLAIDWWNDRRRFPGGANVIMRSMVLPHGDYRLTCTPVRVEPDLYVPHAAAYGAQYAISTYEPFYRPSDAGRRNAEGIATYNPAVAMIDLPAILNMQRNGDPNIPVLPLGNVNVAALASYRSNIDPNWVSPTDHAAAQATYYSSPERRTIFSWGRRDGHGVTPHRGTSDPSDTGDFDTGYAGAPDGPYMNFPDDGDFRSPSDPYFDRLDTKVTNAPPPTLSPNLLVRSPVDFGSIPTGINCRVPWQTLRFRPDQGMFQPNLRMRTLADHPPPRRPFANFCGPRDHQFLDLFWMPVVEPWSISEPFSTKGKINLNQQIFPFLYIERTTALWALLRGERMVAIHNDAATKYKDPNNADRSYRYFINPEETVRQFNYRYDGVALDPTEVELPFNCFRSATEVCELWLVPEKFGNGDRYESDEKWTLEYIIGDPARGYGFWEHRKLTGDNLRERPYANIYPRVCVRSNVFKVHMITQTLQKARSSSPETFDPAVDSITAEWRGAATLERSIDSGDRELNQTQNDYITATNETTLERRKKIDEFYTYRVTEIKQISE